MREGLPAPSPSLDFPGGCGTVVWPGWSSVGIKEDVQGVSAAVLVALCDPGGGGMILVGVMLPAFGVAIQELQRNFVMGDLRALSSSFLPPWPK